MATFDHLSDATPPMSTLLLQGHDMIAQTAAAHSARWGLGTGGGRWALDIPAGSLRWTFPDHTAEASAQIVGSWSGDSRTWQWAWADETLPTSLVNASQTVREYGQQHRQPMLTTPMLHDIDAERANDLAAIAFRLSTATGFYRAPSTGPTWFMTFGQVTITSADQTTRTFSIALE